MNAITTNLMNESHSKTFWRIIFIKNISGIIMFATRSTPPFCSSFTIWAWTKISWSSTRSNSSTNVALISASHLDPSTIARPSILMNINHSISKGWYMEVCATFRPSYFAASCTCLLNLKNLLCFCILLSFLIL